MAAAAINKPYPDADNKVELEEAYLKSLAGVYHFEDGSKRSIFYEKGEMYSQREGSNRFTIFPISQTEFAFENGFATFTFDKNN